MEILNPAAIDYGVARFTLPGQEECGDDHVVSCNGSNVLFAVVDGVGHGGEAAAAAKLATSTIAKCGHEPIDSIVCACHEQLRGTRGVAMSLASVEITSGMMTWLGIGNVQGLLRRGGPEQHTYQQALLLRSGIVGIRLPPLQHALLPVTPGDTLIFATDGIRSSFAEDLSPLAPPQRTADKILDRYRNGNDDALVFVARFSGKGV